MTPEQLTEIEENFHAGRGSLREIPKLIIEVRWLQAQKAELIKALKPFADSADDWEFLQARGHNVDATDVVPLCLGSYQAARTAIAKVEGGEG